MPNFYVSFVICNFQVLVTDNRIMKENIHKKLYLHFPALNFNYLFPMQCLLEITLLVKTFR